ncbi:hypothetical protein BX070DRAFT_227121 [Coemansia spiralis]|nr:hypothetical protein BX070DRAFT_227121 [Coemansia spiralis]
MHSTNSRARDRRSFLQRRYAADRQTAPGSSLTSSLGQVVAEPNTTASALLIKVAASKLTANAPQQSSAAEPGQKNADSSKNKHSRAHAYTTRSPGQTESPALFSPKTREAFTFRLPENGSGTVDNRRAAATRRPSVDMGIEGQAPRVRRPSTGAGPFIPDPLMPVEECNERIERLIQRVRQKHREYTAIQALTSPTMPSMPTRLDPSPIPSPVLSRRGNDRQCRTAAASSETVSTASLGGGSNHSASGVPERQDNADNAIDYADGLFSPRRRAVTMDQSTRDSKRKSRVAAGMQDTPNKSPSSIRVKLEKLRARRLARMEAEAAAAATEETAASPEHSPISPLHAVFSARGDVTNSVYMSSGHTYSNGEAIRQDDSLEPAAFYGGDEDPDFFDNREIVALFQEMPLPLKDIDWDKQVYYYHVGQTNEAYRKAAEEVEIRDCRAECLIDLLGEKKAMRVLNASKRKKQAAEQMRRRRASGESGSAAETIQGLSSHSIEMDEDDANALLSWIDDDSNDDGYDDGEELSFDWSRAGFGYMEFRRQSRASLSSISLLSPGGDNGGGTLGRDANALPPLPLPSARATAAAPHSGRPAVGAPKTPVTAAGTTAFSSNQGDSQNDFPSASLLGTTTSNSVWNLSPVTARVAADNFSEAIQVPKSPPRASSGRELLTRLPGSVGRALSQRRGNAGLRSGEAKQMRPASVHVEFANALLPRIAESGSVEGSDDGRQLASHANGTDPVAGAAAESSAEAELRRLTSENEWMEHEIARVRPVIAALTRAVMSTTQ